MQELEDFKGFRAGTGSFGPTIGSRGRSHTPHSFFARHEAGSKEKSLMRQIGFVQFNDFGKAVVLITRSIVGRVDWVYTELGI